MNRISKGISFSRIELNDLFRSFIFITAAFTIADSGLQAGIGTLKVLIYSAIAVGLGFILHELSHKFMAQNYGCWSEFRANHGMLWISLIFSFMGFVLIAPGAVMIKGSLTKKEYGKVSAAGPIANIVLAIIFLSIAGFSELGRYGAHINAWIALFNLIPVMPFDGIKIFRWSKIAYFLMAAISIIIMFLA